MAVRVGVRVTVGVRVAVRVAVGVHADYLNTAFAAIKDRRGSIDTYLAEALGVDEALRARLHERLLG